MASHELQPGQRRVALVTGSSRGIGAAIARVLARDGFDVCLNSPSERGLAQCEALGAELKEAYGASTLSYAADVSDAEAASALVDAVQARFGRIDVLVNNAGITRDGLLVRMSDADFDDVVAVNLRGTFACSRRAAKYMMRQRYGRIVSLSSVVGLRGNAGQVNYAASKAGVVGITKSIAKELGGRGITANAVAPGFIQTAMTAELSEEVLGHVESIVACKRMGTPEEVAEVVAFLASERASYVNGQVIGIDGGISL